MNEIVFAARREPAAKRVVVDVAFDVMAKGFKAEKEAEKPDPDWSRQVSRVLDELDTKAKLRELLLFERLYGWAALGLSYVDYGDDPSKPVQDPKKILALTVFSDHNCTIMGSDIEKDEKSERAGQPNLYTIKFGSTTKKIHYTRMIHFASRKMGHPWRGVPVLEVLYSDLTAYRNAREAIVHTINTHAAGFADITLKGKKSKTQIDSFERENQLADLDVTTLQRRHAANVIADESLSKGLVHGRICVPGHRTEFVAGECGLLPIRVTIATPALCTDPLLGKDNRPGGVQNDKHCDQ